MCVGKGLFSTGRPPSVLEEVGAQALVWVPQRDHVLDPEEQSNRDKRGGCGDNTDAVPSRPHAT